METPLIKYNLQDRGRQHTGIERNFDIPKIVAAINSAECQERVKNRDMIGFYGHWPRIKFGLSPAEGGLDKGRAVIVEPAIVTTYLRAYPDGTVEHREEFLPTQSGELSLKLWQAKTGGFSSAIDTLKPKFHGNDYVNAANFTKNRGYALDSAFCADGLCSLGMTLDDIEHNIYEEQVAGMMQLLDSANLLHTNALQSIEQLEEQLEELRRSNDRKTAEIEKLNRYLEKAKERTVLDSAYTRESVHRLINAARDFHAVKKLPTIDEPSDNEKTEKNPYLAKFRRG